MLIITYKGDKHDIGFTALERVDGSTKPTEFGPSMKSVEVSQLTRPVLIDGISQAKHLPHVGRENRQRGILFRYFLGSNERKELQNRLQFLWIVPPWKTVPMLLLTDRLLNVRHIDNEDWRHRKAVGVNRAERPL